MYDPKKLKELLCKALQAAGDELYSAACELEENTTPPTPRPECTFGELLPGVLEVEWPYSRDSREGLIYRRVSAPGNRTAWETVNSGALSLYILQVCQYHPDRVLAAVYRLKEAAAWCLERRKERRAAAEEIVRLQLPALRALEELVGEKVWKGPEPPEKKQRRVLQVK